MKKRVLAIMLACLMLVSLLPMGALAAEYKCPGKGEDHNLTNCTYEVVETVKPECGTEKYGYTLYSCTMCGDVFAANFVQTTAKEHDYVLVGGTNCLDGGQRVCSICDAVANAHDFPEKAEHCDEARKCKVCGAEETNADGELIVGSHVLGAEPSKIVSAPNELTGESGWAVYTCTVCEDTEVIEILAHECEDYVGSSIPAGTADCKKDALKAHWECAICGKYYVYDNGYVEVEYEDLLLEKAKHTMPTLADRDVYVAPTCTTEGYAEYECVVCEEYVKETLPIAHQYGAANQEVPATCTTFGYKIYICSNLNCPNGTYIETVAPLGHSARPADATKKDATCTADAYYEWICEKGGTAHTAIETIPGTKLGHDIKKVTVAADCKMYAYTYAYCDNDDCDHVGLTQASQLSYEVVKVDGQGNPVMNGTTPVMETKYVDLPATLWLDLTLCSVNVAGGLDENNHVRHDESNDITRVDPTCTTAGWVYYMCENCNELSLKVLDALGHEKSTNDADKVNVAPTCAADGYKGVKCTRFDACKYIFDKEVIPYVKTTVYTDPTQALADHTHFTLNGTTTTTTYWICADGCPTATDDTAAHLCACVNYITGYCSGSKVNNYTGCKEIILIKIGGGHYTNDTLGAKPAEIFVTLQQGVAPTIQFPTGLAIANYDLYAFDSWSGEWAQANPYMLGIDPATMTFNGPAPSLDIKLVPNTATLAAAEFAAAAATCTTNGWTAQFVCDGCGTPVVSESYVADDPATTDVNEEEHAELKAFGHTKVNVVAAVAPTCATGGRTEGFDCTVCKLSVKSEPIAALGHAWDWINDVTEEDYTCSLYQCDTCDTYTVQDFRAICDHVWVENRDEKVESTCKVAGSELYECSLCGAEKTVALKIAPHVNADGVKFYACTKTAENVKRDCVVCKQTSIAYNANHSFTAAGATKDYAPTCTEYGYTVHYCDNCDYSDYKINTAQKPLGHDWEVTPVIVNGVIMGAVKVCNTCDEEVKLTDSVEYLAFSFGIANAVNVEKATITDGSLIKVTVKVNAKNAPIWGVRLDLAHSQNLTFVNASASNSSFIAFANGNVDAATGTRYVSLYVQASGAADVTINGETALCDLYFRVNKLDRYNNLEQAVDGDGNPIANTYVPEAVKIEASAIDARSTEKTYAEESVVAAKASANTVEFMNLDGKAGISVDDIFSAYTLMTENKYNAAVDINKNGTIDADDLLALYLYFVGNKSYEKTVQIGITQ